MTDPVIICGSAGSFSILFKLFPKLANGFTFPLIVCVHRLRNTPRGYINTIITDTSFKVIEPEEGMKIESGNLYIAPADRHLVFRDSNTFGLSKAAPVNYSRPSIDITLSSAAKVFSDRVIGILLSGANFDGTEGLKAIHQAGGTTIVQDPSDAEIPVMPQSAVDSFTPSHIFSAEKILTFIGNLSVLNEKS